MSDTKKKWLSSHPSASLKAVLHSRCLSARESESCTRCSLRLRSGGEVVGRWWGGGGEMVGRWPHLLLRILDRSELLGVQPLHIADVAQPVLERAACWWNVGDRHLKGAPGWWAARRPEAPAWPRLRSGVGRRAPGPSDAGGGGGDQTSGTRGQADGVT